MSFILNYKTFFIFGAVILVLVLFFLAGWFLNSYRKIDLSVNNIKIEAEIADTFQKKARGLSGRKSIAEGEGMLFIYENSGFYSFWMLGMNFALDIIWIDENYKIIDIDKNVSPDSFPKTFRSENPAKYILEVPAGFSDKNNVKLGDYINGF